MLTWGRFPPFRPCAFWKRANARQDKTRSFDLAGNIATRDGKMLFLIDQQPYLQGYLPVVMLVQHDKYAVIPAGVVGTGPGFVTPDNAARVIDLSAKGFR